MKAGYETMDGTWVAPKKAPVRPEKPTIPVGEWVELPDQEQGKAWVRHRASKDLRGPFSALVQGLDCLQSTSARYGVRKIDFQPDLSSAGGAVLAVEIDLFLSFPLDPKRETPWAKQDSWGEAERPERVRVLKDRTVANPFAG